MSHPAHQRLVRAAEHTAGFEAIGKWKDLLELFDRRNAEVGINRLFAGEAQPAVAGHVYPRTRVCVLVLVNISATVVHGVIAYDILGELSAGRRISRSSCATRQIRPLHERPACAGDPSVEDPLRIHMTGLKLIIFTVNAGVGYRFISDLNLTPQTIGNSFDPVWNGARRAQRREAHIRSV